MQELLVEVIVEGFPDIIELDRVGFTGIEDLGDAITAEVDGHLDSVDEVDASNTEVSSPLK